jgi:hypothetical protein
MQQDAGKGESLLLAPGERLIPWRLLLKTIDEVLSPTRLSASAISSMPLLSAGSG